MALTSEDLTLKLVAGMFAAAPGKTYLELVAHLIDTQGLAQTAIDLGNTAQFQLLYPPTQTHHDFALSFAASTIPGFNPLDAAHARAVDWVTGKLDSGEPVGKVVLDALTALYGIAEDNAIWGATRALWDQRVERAEHYSVDLGLSSTSVAVLQDALLPPELADAQVNGSALVLSFNDLNGLDASAPPPLGAFAVEVAGTSRAVEALTVDSAAGTVTLALASPVIAGESVNVAYADPSGGNDAPAIQDINGNDAGGFNVPVSNLTVGWPPHPDRTSPTVTIDQAAAQPGSTNNGIVNYTVVFSEPVRGFTNADISTAGSTATIGAITVTGSGTTYNVAVASSGNGTVIASVVASGARDAAGNLSAASTSTDNVITLDTTPPTVTIDQAAAQVDPAQVAKVNFKVLFSEAVTGFTEADVTLTGTAGLGGVTKTITGGSGTYNVEVSGITGDGTVIANIASGVAQDVAGNDNSASTSSDNAVTVDVAPFGVVELSSLGGSTGFRLNGAAATDRSGDSVGTAGDVNGDGFADLIVGAVGADPNGTASGASYVVFGKAPGYPSAIELSSLDGSTGFQLIGEAAFDNAGCSVSAAGDVNGDGFADLIVGARRADPNGSGSGASYVVFGKAAGFSSTIELSSLDGSDGFRLNGAASLDYSGRSVSAAGDVNGDGFADLIVGAFGADPNGSLCGASYVVFGKAAGFSSAMELSSLDGSTGIRLNGATARDYAGLSVSAAGDVNGDGFADLIVGGFAADPNGSYSGTSYVVFGKASGNSSVIELSSLDGSTGFRLNGAAADDRSGFSVSAAGDVNGDGFADLIVGAVGADPNGTYSGTSYVVFGKASGFSAAIELSSLNGGTGIRLNGVGAGDYAGYSVSAAGDVNGDGFADLIIGAYGADPNGSATGASYVVFGKASGFSSTIELSSLDGSTGFRLNGVATDDYTGFSVSTAGDVNGDGFDDLIVGAPGAEPNGFSSGASYVVFGGNSTNAVTFLGTSGPDNLNAGTAAAERFVAGGDDDTMTGGGGADVFHGGEGNDTIIVSDLAFQLVDGGSGTDTLALPGSGMVLDLAAVRGHIDGVEVIDITGSGNNTLNLTALDLLNLADTSNTLTVDGNAGDAVNAAGLWFDGGVAGGYHAYTQGAATLKVNTAIAAVGIVVAVSSIELSSLDGITGFRLNGAAANNQSGACVNAAGDVNGDGFADLIVGAYLAGPNGSSSGTSYVVFGKASGFSSAVDLSSLDDTTGFRLDGAAVNDLSGHSVSAAGDINGDGFADLVVGARGADPNGNDSGASYVVFGKAAGFSSGIELSSLDDSTGFRLNGVATNDYAGYSVSAAGDVNGDGFADLIVGAFGADPHGIDSGASYVVFGKAAGFSSVSELSSLDDSSGFRLNGVAAHDYSGFCVSAAGDVNGDGFADLIIGAYWSDQNGAGSGASYVVFGKAAGFSSGIELSSLDGSTGFRLNGVAARDYSGHSVRAAGDVNGDGFADLIVGAHRADPNGSASGASYVVFGKASGFSSAIELSGLDGVSGFRLNGVAVNDYSGYSVSAAGDVNGDGFADLIIGAFGADPNGGSSGASYVVFGKAAGFASVIELSSLDGGTGFRLNGVSAYDGSGISVSAAGDVNGDGFDDLIVGAPWVDRNGDYSFGASYVVFGGNSTGAVTFLGTSGADNLNAGTAAAERFVAGGDDDTMTGDGGADVFHGGEGNDTIVVSDLAFQLADGGSGTDTFALSGSGIVLDLAAVRGHIDGVEAIDLTGSGNNTLNLSALDLLNLADTSNTLMVEGNNGDHVNAVLGAGFVANPDVVVGGNTYHSFTQGAATLLVAVGIAPGDISVT